MAITRNLLAEIEERRLRPDPPTGSTHTMKRATTGILTTVIRNHGPVISIPEEKWSKLNLSNDRTKSMRTGADLKNRDDIAAYWSRRSD